MVCREREEPKVIMMDTVSPWRAWPAIAHLSEVVDGLL
jgi:hypothetical protein